MRFYIFKISKLARLRPLFKLHSGKSEYFNIKKDERVVYDAYNCSGNYGWFHILNNIDYGCSTKMDALYVNLGSFKKFLK